MSKKKLKRRSPRARPAPSQAPLLKTVIRSFLKLFEEDLPVTEFQGPGKFDTEVKGVERHQAALEAICGGRTAKAQKHLLTALVTPMPRDNTMRVEIQRKVVGQLKPADAKFLQKQLSSVQTEGPCAVRVSALIQGGRRKKNGEEEAFTVALCLPPKPEKKPAAREEAVQRSSADGADLSAVS